MGPFTKKPYQLTLLLMDINQRLHTRNYYVTHILRSFLAKDFLPLIYYRCPVIRLAFPFEKCRFYLDNTTHNFGVRKNIFDYIQCVKTGIDVNRRCFSTNSVNCPT